MFMLLGHITSEMRHPTWVQHACMQHVWVWTQQLLTNWEQVLIVYTVVKMWLGLRSHCCFQPAQWRPLKLDCWQSRHDVMLFAGHSDVGESAKMTTTDVTTRSWFRLTLQLQSSRLMETSERIVCEDHSFNEIRTPRTKKRGVKVKNVLLSVVPFFKGSLTIKKLRWAVHVTLVQTEMPETQLDGLPWNLVQIFIVTRGWTLMILVIYLFYLWHHHVADTVMLTHYFFNK